MLPTQRENIKVLINKVPEKCQLKICLLMP